MSGCSLLIMSTRAPAPRTCASSGACRIPSTVRSTTSEDARSAAIGASRRASAREAPVERIGIVEGAGEGTTTWNGRAPSRASASSASSTLSRRDCVSETIATSSSRCTAHWRKTSSNAAIHLASIRSERMWLP